MEASREPDAARRLAAVPWWRTSPLAWLPLLLVRIYQLTLSPLLGPSCRFEPSCSRYADACLRRFGFVRGAWLAACRIARCQPFHPGGYDPPPERWPPERSRRDGRTQPAGPASPDVADPLEGR
jgi:hypothetical protein